MTDAIDERERTLAAFLETEKRRIALCCYALARAFEGGATLLAYGAGAAASDAAHVAVEFMHPVIVGKRALPALAPPNDVFALMRAGDVALGIDAGAAQFLGQARQADLLTVSLDAGPADFAFEVPIPDPYVRQEIHETTYHVLWELVHVFFEQPVACITCGDVAVEARVVGVNNGTATIEKDGAREQVAVDLVEDVEVGDILLCHAGVAIEKVP